LPRYARIRGAGIAVIQQAYRLKSAIAEGIAAIRCAGVVIVADFWNVIALPVDAIIHCAGVSVIHDAGGG